MELYWFWNKTIKFTPTNAMEFSKLWNETRNRLVEQVHSKERRGTPRFWNKITKTTTTKAMELEWFWNNITKSFYTLILWLLEQDYIVHSNKRREILLVLEQDYKVLLHSSTLGFGTRLHSPLQQTPWNSLGFGTGLQSPLTF